MHDEHNSKSRTIKPYRVLTREHTGHHSLLFLNKLFWQINGVSVTEFVKLAISRQIPWPIVLPDLDKTPQLQTITKIPTVNIIK